MHPQTMASEKDESRCFCTRKERKTHKRMVDSPSRGRGEMVNNCHLPPEIIENILSWLPIKSLYRFKCVTKRWHSLIATTEFSRLRFEHAPHAPKINTQKLLISTRSAGLQSLDCESCSEDELALVDLDFPFKRTNCEVDMVGSCNGLVCLALDKYVEFFLWNPSTGIYRKLPNPGNPVDSQSYSYGFGYDSSCGDYKIVLSTYYAAFSYGYYHRPLNSDAAVVEVFSLKQNSWKRIRDLHFPDKGIVNGSKSCRGVFLNDALHWKPNNRDVDKINAFDLALEVFYEVAGPSFAIEEHYNDFYKLAILDERLCLLCTCLNHASLEVWVMKEYGVKESWTKLAGLVDCEKLNYHWDLTLLCVTKNGAYISMNNKIQLVKCKPAEHGVCQFTAGEHDCEAIPYIENPVSPYVWND